MFPDISHQPQFHNPFPQLYRVAVLPFYNQSSDPHLHGIQVAEAYYQEIQQIPGFEVMPVGTVVRFLETSEFEPHSSDDFQKLARELGVDAVLVGAITDYTAYYPPRMGLSVNWYAANPGFHPIPAGYGLPWGTSEEEYIPSSLVREAEFALAREQLATQTPELVSDSDKPPVAEPPRSSDAHAAKMAQNSGQSVRRQVPRNLLRAGHNEPTPAVPPQNAAAPEDLEEIPTPTPEAPTHLNKETRPSDLPINWPDPRGFVPLPPAATRPQARPQSRPIITHTKLYEGHNSDVTEALANYVYFRDDARFGGWQGYLQRSDDFIRFCCHMHLTETLAARGGADESRVVWRWPIGRYER